MAWGLVFIVLVLVLAALYLKNRGGSASVSGQHLLGGVAWVWPEFERIYGIKAEIDVEIRLLAAHQMPPAHPACYYYLGMRHIALNRSGYGGKSPDYWLAAELHNYYRNECELPYMPADPDDAARFSRVKQLISVIK